MKNLLQQLEQPEHFPAALSDFVVELKQQVQLVVSELY